jgi:uncharacterized protein (TIGR02271 family)
MANEDINRVAPLSELNDYKVADGDPDIRGWDVTTERGDKVGEVDDLIVDTGAMKVRYIAVDLDERVAGPDRKVLVPIGAAQLDDHQDRVLVVGISPDQFATLPEYRREAFDRDYESTLLSSYGRDRETAADTTGSDAGRSKSEDYYASRHFDDTKFFGTRRGPREARVTRSEEELSFDKRPVPAGEVEVRKTVETEHVREPVTRTREEVTIERHAVEGQRSGDVEIGEDEIRVPVVEEEVIVEKRPVVKEEIVVKKQAVADERTIEADVRRERVDVDDSSLHRDGGARGDAIKERGSGPEREAR